MSRNSCPLLTRDEQRQIEKFAQESDKNFIQVYNGKCSIREALGCYIQAVELNMRVLLQEFLDTDKGQNYRAKLEELKDPEKEAEREKLINKTLIHIVNMAFKSVPAIDDKGNDTGIPFEISNRVKVPSVVVKDLNDAIQEIKDKFPVQEGGRLTVSQFSDLRYLINDTAAKQGYLGTILLRDMITFINCGNYFKVIFREAVAQEKEAEKENCELFLGKEPEDEEGKKEYKEKMIKYHRLADSIQRIKDYNEEMSSRVQFDWVNHEYYVITGRKANGELTREKISMSASTASKKGSRINSQNNGSNNNTDEDSIQFKFGNAFDNIARDLFMHLNAITSYNGKNNSLLLELESLLKEKQLDGDKYLEVDPDAYVELLKRIEDRIRTVIFNKKKKLNGYLEKLERFNELRASINDAEQKVANEGEQSLSDEEKRKLDEDKEQYAILENEIEEEGAPDDWVNVFILTDEADYNSRKGEQKDMFDMQVFNTARSILDMYINIKRKMFEMTGDDTCVFMSGTIGKNGDISDLPAYAGVVYDNPNDIKGKYIGGIMDMMVIDSYGVPHIFDFKTQRQASKLKLERIKVGDREFVIINAKDNENLEKVEDLHRRYSNPDQGNSDKSEGEGLRRQYTTQLTYYYKILSSNPALFQIMEYTDDDGNHHSTTLNIVKTYVHRSSQGTGVGSSKAKFSPVDDSDFEQGLQINQYRKVQIPFKNRNGQTEVKEHAILEAYDAARYGKDGNPLSFENFNKQNGDTLWARTFAGFETNPTLSQESADLSADFNAIIDQSNEPTFYSGSSGNQPADVYFRNLRIKSANRYIGELKTVTQRIREMVKVDTESKSEFSAAKEYLRSLMITDEFSVAMGDVIANEFSRNLDEIEEFIEILKKIGTEKIEEIFKDKEVNFDAFIAYLNEIDSYREAMSSGLSYLISEMRKIFKEKEEIEALFFQIRSRDQLIKGGQHSSRYFGGIIRKNIFDKIRDDLYSKFNDIRDKDDERKDEIKSYLDGSFGFRNPDDNDSLAANISADNLNAKIKSLSETDSENQSKIDKFLEIFKVIGDGRSTCVFEYFKMLSLRSIAKNEGISIKRAANKISTISKDVSFIDSVASENEDNETADDVDDESTSILEDLEEFENAETIEEAVARWGTGNDEKNFRESVSVLVKKALSRIPSGVTDAEAYRNPFFYFIKDLKTYDAGKLTDVLIRHLSKCGDLSTMKETISKMVEAKIINGRTGSAILNMLNSDESFASKFYNAFSKYQNIFTVVVSQMNEETGEVHSYLQVINASAGSRDIYKYVKDNSTTALRLLRAYTSLDPLDIEAIESDGSYEKYEASKPSNEDFFNKVTSAFDLYLEYTSPYTYKNKDGEEVVGTKLDWLKENSEDDASKQFLYQKTSDIVGYILSQLNNSNNRTLLEVFNRYVENKENGSLSKDVLDNLQNVATLNDDVKSQFKGVVMQFINYRYVTSLNKVTGSKHANRRSFLRVRNVNNSINTVKKIVNYLNSGELTVDNKVFVYNPAKDRVGSLEFVDEIIKIMKSSSVYEILKKIGINVSKATYDRTIEESRMEEDFPNSKACRLFANVKNLLDLMQNLSEEQFAEINNYRDPDIFEKQKNGKLSESTMKKVGVARAIYWDICETLSSAFENVVQSGAYTDGKMRYTYINRSYITEFIHKINGSDPLETRESFIKRNFLKPQFFPQSAIDDFLNDQDIKKLAGRSYNAIIRDLLLNPELTISHSQCVSYNGFDYKGMSPLQYAAALVCNFYGCNETFSAPGSSETRPMRNYRISIFSNKPSLELVKFRSYSVEEVEKGSLNILDQECARIRIALERLHLNYIDGKVVDNGVECFDVDWKKLYTKDSKLFDYIRGIFKVDLKKDENPIKDLGYTDYLNILKEIIKLPSKGSSKSATAFNALEFVNNIIEEANPNDNNPVVTYILAHVFPIDKSDEVFIYRKSDSDDLLIKEFRKYMTAAYQKQLKDYRDRGLFNSTITHNEEEKMITISFPCMGGNVRSLHLKYDVNDTEGKYMVDLNDEESKFVLDLLGIKLVSNEDNEDAVKAEIENNFNTKVDDTNLRNLAGLIQRSYSQDVKKWVRDSIFDRLLNWKINNVDLTEEEKEAEKDKKYKTEYFDIYHENSDTYKNGLGFSILEEYFYSDWFVTYNMTNITTSDLAFYKNHVEFQKRQAQMHSSSSKFNKEATWGGKRVSDGKIRYVLIEDFNGSKFSSKILSTLKGVFKDEFENMKARFLKDHNKESINELSANEKAEWDSIKITYDAEVNTILKKFDTKIDLTDGQSYTSPTGYRKKMISAGKWTKEHEEAFLAAINTKDKSVSDYFKMLEGLKVLCQPIKPFGYGLLDGGDINVPFQVKNSEYMLFVAGIIADRSNKTNTLKILNDLMERSHYNLDRSGNIILSERRTDGIDTIAFKSCIKVGASTVLDVAPQVIGKNNETGEPVLESDKQILDRLESVIYSKDGGRRYTAAVKELDMDDYGIQQEVPAHYANHYQQMASQSRILVESDAPDHYYHFIHGRWIKVSSGNYDTNGSKKIGALDVYESLIAKKIKNAISQFKTEFELENLNTEENRIAFRSKISKVLRDTIGTNEKFVSDLVDAVSLDENGNFCRNLNDEAISNRVQELINSYIRKRINKTEMPGGPVVQVSGCGVSESLHIRWKGKDGKIMMTEDEFNEKLNKSNHKDEKGEEDKIVVIDPYTDPEGNEFDKGREFRSFGEYVEAMMESVAYLPVPSEDIARLLTYNGRLLSPDEAAAKGLITQETADKISRIIGVRIPTEDKYSMLPIKIVGWLSSYYSGEGIMLPDEITVLTGADFDIDKLFVTHYSLKFGSLDSTSFIKNFINSGTPKVKGTIFDKTYDHFVECYKNMDNLKGTDRDIANRYMTLSGRAILSISASYIFNPKKGYDDLSFDRRLEIYKNDNKSLLYFLIQDFGEEILHYNIEDIKKFLSFYFVSHALSMSKDDYLKRIKKAKGNERIELIDTLRHKPLFKSLLKESESNGFSSFDRALLSFALSGNNKFIFLNNIISDENDSLIDKEFTEEGLNDTLGKLKNDQIDNRIFDYQWMFLTDRSTAAKMFNPGSFDPQDKIAKVVTIRRGCDHSSIINFINEIRENKNRAGLSKEKLSANVPVDPDRKKEYENNLYNALLELELDELDDLLSSAETDNHNILFVGSQIYFFEQNMAAAKLIGTIANHNISHAILQRQDIRYHSVDNISISLGNHVAVSARKSGENKGEDLDKGTKLDGLKDCRGIYISKNIAGFLAASVDAAKKPVLNYLNINGLTISPLMCLIRLGFDVNTASMFIAQDAIVELVRRFNQENADGHTNISKCIDDYIRELNKKYVGFDGKDLTSHINNSTKKVFTIAELFASIGRKYDDDNLNNKEKAKYDIQVLTVFQHLVTLSQDVTSMTEQCRFNSMMYAVGPRINNTKARRNSINDFNRRYFLTLRDRGSKEASLYKKVNFDINLGLPDPRIITNSRILSAYYRDIYGDVEISVNKDDNTVESEESTDGLEREIMKALGFIEYNPIYSKIWT